MRKKETKETEEKEESQEDGKNKSVDLLKTENFDT